MGQSRSGSEPSVTLSLGDIEAAAERIAEYAHQTPLLSSSRLDGLVQASVYLKPECLQRTGSFKFRGAYNRLSQLTGAQRKAGVVAWSSGNHAQGIAAAGALLDIQTTVVMPADAPSIKLARTRDYGAEIVLYDRYTQDREAIGRELAQQRGAVLVPSYDDLHIIAGQGTTGLEIFRQARTLEVQLDAVLVCCGGGGLTAGVATAMAQLSPNTQVFAVEPEGFDDHARSLELGSRCAVEAGAHSLCDALLTPTPGSITFALNQPLLAGALVVPDDLVKAAMRFAFSELKLVLEPGGAIALAALLGGVIDLKGKKVAVVLSGGNVAPELFSQVLSEG